MTSPSISLFSTGAAAPGAAPLKSASATGSQLDQDAFLKLLVAQLM